MWRNDIPRARGDDEQSGGLPLVLKADVQKGAAKQIGTITVIPRLRIGVRGSFPFFLNF